MHGWMAALALASPLAAHCAADDVETLKYALRISGGVPKMKKAILAEPGHDEKTRKMLLGIADSYSFDEVAQRGGALIARSITPLEAKNCMRFVRSSAGEVLLQALETAEDQGATEEALRRMPAVHRKPSLQFLSEACYRKAVAASVSPDFLQIQRDYGAELMCEQYERQDPGAFSNLVGKGACKP